jgi:hypothetical protein
MHIQILSFKDIKAIKNAPDEIGKFCFFPSTVDSRDTQVFFAK